MTIEYYLQEKRNASIMISQIYEDIDIYNKMNLEYRDDFLFKQLENKLAYFLMKYEIFHQLCEQQEQKQQQVLEIVDPNDIEIQIVTEKVIESNKDVVEEKNNEMTIATIEEQANNEEEKEIPLKKKKRCFFKRFARQKHKDNITTVEEKVEKEEENKYEHSSSKINQYIHQGFNQQQLDLINEGIEAGVDVDVFADVSRPSYSMRCILSAMEKGLTYTYLLDKQLSQEQLDVLMIFLLSQYDISNISDPSLSSEEMAFEFVRKHYHKQHIDIHDYNLKQLTEIKRGVLNKLNVSLYLDSNFNEEQMYMIRRGLEKKIDVSVYAKPEVPVEMMKDKFYELSLKN